MEKEYTRRDHIGALALREEGPVCDADYEKAEMDQLKDALRRSYKERFLMMTRLMKMNHMFSRAKITYKPYTLDK